MVENKKQMEVDKIKVESKNKDMKIEEGQKPELKIKGNSKEVVELPNKTEIKKTELRSKKKQGLPDKNETKKTVQGREKTKKSEESSKNKTESPKERWKSGTGITSEEEWVPKTKLGRLVKEGKIEIDKIFELGYKIKEFEIVDFLISDLEEKIILIGGSPEKGGGIQRRTIRRTVRVHKSGRRVNLSALVVVGNRRGYIGFGFGRASTNKETVKKAAMKARLNIFPVKRGCGSWECECGREHSVPFTVKGKCGSIVVKLMPAPRGLGLCAPDEIKKVFELVGIEDVRMKTRGQTGTRLNFVYAVEDALRNLNKIKL